MAAAKGAVHTVTVLVLLVCVASARVSPSNVLQLAQDAAADVLKDAQAQPASTYSQDAEVLSQFASIASELTGRGSSVDAAPVEEVRGDAEPWFCHGIDCPAFKVDDSFTDVDGVERRMYDATKWASIRVKGVSYDKAMYQGFMALFRYISGSNVAKAKIPMTAPVRTRIVPGPGPTCENDFIVSFFVPFEFQDDTPEPTEEGVHLEEVDPFTVYVVSFGGRASEEGIVSHASDLADSLSAAGVKVEEDYYFSAGYDPPFRLFHRHNEVWILEAGSGTDAQDPIFGDADADYDLSDIKTFYSISGEDSVGVADWDEYMGEDEKEGDESWFLGGEGGDYYLEDDDYTYGSYFLYELDEYDLDGTLVGGGFFEREEDRVDDGTWGDYDSWEDEGADGLDGDYLEWEDGEPNNKVTKVSDLGRKMIVFDFEVDEDETERWPKSVDDLLGGILDAFRRN